jgi:hypothetical protein
MAAYEAIASTTLSTTTTGVTFSSIPSTYEHLQIRCFTRDSNASNTVVMYLRLNGDTGANYARHALYGDGATAFATGQTATTVIWGAATSAASATANAFGVCIFDVLDYASTNKYKTGRSIGGYDANGNGRADFGSGLWLNTAAVNSVTVFSGGAGFISGSVFALYGLRSS